jgi:hypothetical protein
VVVGSVAVEGVQWGSVAEWVGSLATAGALLGIWWTFRKERQTLNLLLEERAAAAESERRSQADRVAMAVVQRWQWQRTEGGPGGRTVKLYNQSALPIFDPVIRRHRDGQEVAKLAPARTFSPRHDEVFLLMGDLRQPAKSLREYEFWFTDCESRRWVRYGDGHLREASADEETGDSA